MHSATLFSFDMRTFLSFLLIYYASLIFGQPVFDGKRDYEWVFSRIHGTVDSVGLIYLDFTEDTLSLYFRKAYNIGQSLFQTNASICDTAGNLLFFSNGCILSDNMMNLISGADTINTGVRWETHCKLPNSGYVIVNGCWILPVGENKFKVFYADQKNSLLHTTGIRTATVIRDAITGKLSGENPDTYVLEKNLQPELRGFVRHANGRDWWMVNEAYKDKMYFVTYIDSTNQSYNTDSIYFNELPERQMHDGSQACFSPDGTKYATISPLNQCQVFEFDRCSGLLQNPIFIQLPLPYDSILASTGIAISPNSRFMYLMTLWSIWQYDLQANDIEASKIRVAQNDGWLDQWGNPLAFYQSQLGPDGKIYVFAPAGRRAFSVIDQPDSLGLACNVIQHKYFFPYWVNISQPPRFPNFRLGPVVGSPCDTLTSSTTDQAVIQASMLLRPNPATTHTVADLSLPDYSSDMQLSLTVSDLTGNVLASYQVPPYAALQRIETAALPNGLYFITLRSKGQVLKTERLVVLRM